MPKQKHSKKVSILKRVLICFGMMLLVAGVAIGSVELVNWNNRRTALDTPEKQYAYYLDNKELFKDAVDAFIDNGDLQVITTQKQDMIENTDYMYTEPVDGIFLQSSAQIDGGWIDRIEETRLYELFVDERVVTACWQMDIINNYQCIAFYADKNGDTGSGWLYVMNGFEPEFDQFKLTMLEPIDDEWYVFKTEPLDE